MSPEFKLLNVIKTKNIYLIFIYKSYKIYKLLFNISFIYFILTIKNFY